MQIKIKVDIANIAIIKKNKRTLSDNVALASSVPVPNPATAKRLPPNKKNKQTPIKSIIIWKTSACLACR